MLVVDADADLSHTTKLRNFVRRKRQSSQLVDAPAANADIISETGAVTRSQVINQTSRRPQRLRPHGAL